jgi:hypothetical protein
MKGVPMQLTQETFNRLVGGQLEVQNRGENYLYRGEISGIELDGIGDNQKLTVSLNWFAKMSEYGEWEVSDNEPYAISTLIYSFSEIAEGRISFSSTITGETATVFPPDGSKLDPTKVRGLIE